MGGELGPMSIASDESELLVLARLPAGLLSGTKGGIVPWDESGC